MLSHGANLQMSRTFQQHALQFWIENARQSGLSLSCCSISFGARQHTCVTQGQRKAIQALHGVVVKKRTAWARQGFANGTKRRGGADKKAIEPTRQGGRRDVDGHVTVRTSAVTRFQRSDSVATVRLGYRTRHARPLNSLEDFRLTTRSRTRHQGC